MSESCDVEHRPPVCSKQTTLNGRFSLLALARVRPSFFCILLLLPMPMLHSRCRRKGADESVISSDRYHEGLRGRRIGLRNFPGMHVLARPWNVPPVGASKKGMPHRDVCVCMHVCVYVW